MKKGRREDITSVKIDSFDKILKLKGLKFIKELLKFEEKRFDKNFLKSSVYEEINADFGIFPNKKVYPTYFAGNIEKPKNKTILLGINPGYDPEGNKREQDFCEKQGLFYSCCHFFDYCKGNYKGLIVYYANIAGFLKRLYGIEKIDWDWFQENFINLELIPYHSENAAGLRINDVKKFKERYFKIILKFLEYIKPKDKIFINGFPTFKKYFENKEFKNSIKFKKHKNIWIGKIENEFDFIGLPFLTRVKGGKEELVKNIKDKDGKI